jgi:hypothetical protein
MKTGDYLFLQPDQVKLVKILTQSPYREVAEILIMDLKS